jgi:hypothetical protein
MEQHGARRDDTDTLLDRYTEQQAPTNVVASGGRRTKRARSASFVGSCSVRSVGQLRTRHSLDNHRATATSAALPALLVSRLGGGIVQL